MDGTDLVVSNIWERAARGEDVHDDWLGLSASVLDAATANPKLTARPGVRSLCAALVEFARAHFATRHLANGDPIFEPPIGAHVTALSE